MAGGDAAEREESRVCFSVQGLPRTQGSMRAFVPKGRSWPVVVHEKGRELESWRSLVAGEARRVAPSEPWAGPVSLDVVFLLPRPGGHYGSGRNAERLRPAAPLLPACKPDLDKLLRGIGDALRGVLYRDDAQLVDVRARKVYGVPGAAIEVRRLRGGGT